MWGTPRKRALFGPEGQGSVSSVSDVAEGQSGCVSGRGSAFEGRPCRRGGALTKVEGFRWNLD